MMLGSHFFIRNRRQGYLSYYASNRAMRKSSSFPPASMVFPMLTWITAALVWFIPYVVGQTATIATCQSGFAWAFNTLGQSPCQVAAALAEACLLPGTNFSIPSLLPGENYLGPSQGLATQCQCSSVYYSLLSACALCQGADVLNWSKYDANCTTPFLTVFPSPIPAGFKVPHYAYLDVSVGDMFNATAAEAAGGPESTSPPQPTATSTVPSASTTPTSTTGKKSNAGAIAGGVVGGVVAIAILALLAFWLRRRRRGPSTPAYSEPIINDHKTPMDSVTPFATSPTPKLYDPNDPSTFPNMAHSNSFGASTQSFPAQVQGEHHFHSTHVMPSFTGSTQTSAFPRTGPQYTGIAEVM